MNTLSILTVAVTSSLSLAGVSSGTGLLDAPGPGYRELRDRFSQATYQTAPARMTLESITTPGRPSLSSELLFSVPTGLIQKVQPLPLTPPVAPVPK